MKTALNGPDRDRFGSPPRMVTMLVTTLLLLATVVWVQPSQAAPLAGTSIGNQASATYTDASNAPRTATSNTVQTIVQQVAGLTLDATQSKSGAPGGTIYFPHTLTNTGNGSDTFSLGSVGNSSPFTFTNIAMYADANGDGVPDNFNPLTSSGPLAPGASFKFILAATVPPAATDSQSNTVTATATSTFTPAITANNIDTANVSGNAIIAMTKSVSPSSGNPGSGPITYTLTYTNTGNATATNLVITDVVPAGMSYNTGNKARWSVTTATALTDAAGDTQGTAPNTINYDATTTVGTVSATIAQVLPGETRTLTFEVNVASGATPGIINNTANFTYNDGVNPNKTGSTNTTPFTVNQNAGVAANGSNSSNAINANDPIIVPSATQGSTVQFDVYIWNTGNGTDSFDISPPAPGTFPLGTSFQLYKSDGVTPLIDTNSNSTPDTGPLGLGASYKVVVKAILPANATGGPVSTTLTATSKQDSTKNDPAILTLTAITANTVDLTLTTARTDSSPAGIAASGNAASYGFGAGPAAVLTPHNATNPGTTTTFVLKVNNTSPSADTYNMAASTNNTFAPTTLPTGWTVEFKADGGAGTCSTLGATIANTGVINAGANATVCAIVSVPSNAPAGTQEIDFRVLSPSSGANDPIRCAVDVNTIRALTVTNNQTGQVFPGGTVVYSMTVTNNGNVAEGTVPSSGTPNGTSDSKVVLGVADSLVAQGWTSVVYFDENGNGIIDATDPVVTDLSFSSNSAPGLAPGESVPLLVKVFAPAGAATGDTDVATLTATTTGAINGVILAPSSATGTSTVISGQVTLTKTQALDANCDGTADTAYGQANITTGAIPGACIQYKITATNVGTASVTTLVVSDATPSNTVYNAGTQCPAVGGTFVAATTVGTITAPTQCSAGTISATVGALNPGSSAVVTFGVQINR
ncbi:MAG: isopeptide-forming domain-containing fimbrial protein [Desulfuromonadales bacterium]|nr:isopeptide-forming domain-containing fimbrial protein [Desulfuromonadales bacterium]